MTDHIMLDTTANDAVQVLATAFMDALREAIGPQPSLGPNESAAFAASVGCQAIQRALYLPTDGDLNQAVIMGASEGIGMLLGLVEEPLNRTTLFQLCVRAMHAGLTTQAQIHSPQGQA